MLAQKFPMQAMHVTHAATSSRAGSGPVKHSLPNSYQHTMHKYVYTNKNTRWRCSMLRFDCLRGPGKGQVHTWPLLGPPVCEIGHLRRILSGVQCAASLHVYTCDMLRHSCRLRYGIRPPYWYTFRGRRSYIRGIRVYGLAIYAFYTCIYVYTPHTHPGSPMHDGVQPQEVAL